MWVICQGETVLAERKNASFGSQGWKCTWIFGETGLTGGHIFVLGKHQEIQVRSWHRLSPCCCVQAFGGLFWPGIILLTMFV